MRLGIDIRGTKTVAVAIAALGEPLVAGTRRILNGWAADSAFLASLDLASRVRVIPLGFPAAAVGAALGGGHAWPKS